MSKEKHLILDEETHQMVKDQSKVAGMTMQGYARSCFIMCKSDKGSQRLSLEQKHKDIMILLGLSENSTREDIMGTNLINIYDYLMGLKVVS